MKLSKYDNKLVRIKYIDGNTYEGIGLFYSNDYCYHEYGVDEDAIEIMSIIFYKSAIKKIEIIDHYTDSYSGIEELLEDYTYDDIDDLLDNDKYDNRSVKRLLDYYKSINKFDKEKLETLYNKYVI